MWHEMTLLFPFYRNQVAESDYRVKIKVLTFIATLETSNTWIRSVLSSVF